MEGQHEPAHPSTEVQDELLSAVEAAGDVSMAGTTSQDLLSHLLVKCYVCSQPGTAERLTSCMAAPVYRRLTAGHNQQSIDAATTASDPLLCQFLQIGKAGTVARQVEGAKHCQRHFHQACLGRRKEAVFDNRVTIVKQLKDGTQETRVKDIRHRLCGECLQLEQGSQETQYTGLLDGGHPLHITIHAICKAGQT